MSRLFYSIEVHDGKKEVHIHGEIYNLGCGKEDVSNSERFSYNGDICRSAEFTGEYFDFSTIQSLGKNLIEAIYLGGNQVYECDITPEEAEECYNTYFFNDNGGTEFNIFDCTHNTPCGNYWCEMN